MQPGRRRQTSIFSRFLIFIGKPFYLVIFYLVIFTTTFLQILLSLKLPTIKPPKLTLPKPKITIPSPKIKLPHIKIQLPHFKIKLQIIPILILFLISYILFLFFHSLPNPQQLLHRQSPLTTKIYDRHGQLLYNIYQDQNRTLVKLNDLPPYVIKATLAIEDAEFYQHTGFSIKGILRAFKKNVTENNRQGGSTITQQLVKNTLLTSEKTLIRKLKELILALEVEAYFTKNEILTMYLNEVGYGGVSYGIAAASESYFGKNVKDLNLSEATLLAGLPASPTTYSPFGVNPELAISRQYEVLRRMVEENYITPEESEAAKSFKLQFKSPQTDIRAPHFVMYVKDLLVNRYGEEVVSRGGLNVITSLDLNLQTLAETAIAKELARLKSLHVTNAAALITNPKTGEILAMVGSKDYFNTAQDGQVNITLRPRQPGSSIKPLTYALAFENGFTPSSMIEDSPITYRSPGSPPYSPQNYDGQYHGSVTLRQALASSYNIPAVKLLSHLGVNRLVEKGRQFGLTTWDDPSRFGLSLTLGGGEVKMVDMAVLYGTLANLGKRVDLHPIISITDSKQKTFTDNPCQLISSTTDQVYAAENPLLKCPTTSVVSSSVAYQITNILSDNSARAPAFGNHSVLNIPTQQVAVKTGTTNSLRDNWTFGFTSDYLVATWVGNNDNTPMSYVASGITGASPIWNTIFTNLLDKNNPHHFELPSDLIKVTICPLTGTLTCAECPNPKTEYFTPGTEPKKACNKEIIQPILEKRDQLLNGITTSAP